MVTGWRTIARRLEDAVGTPHRLTAMSILRIMLGVNVTALYLQHVPQRHFLWGANGVLPYPAFVAQLHAAHSWSIWQYAASPAFETVLYYGGALVALAFTAGFATRVSAVLFWAFTWSLFQRNPYVLDGGDNLLYLVAFLMMFADCGARFSVDALLGRRRRPNRYAALLHNAALVSIITQVCLLYFTSAFYKIQGHVWQDGTAIYYILRNSAYDVSPFGAAIYNSALLGTVLTYGTIVLQAGFPFLILHKRLKWVVAPAALSFHLGIAYFMGLTWFSETMMAAETVFFTDGDYQRIGSLSTRALAVLRRRFKASPPAPAALTTDAGG